MSTHASPGCHVLSLQLVSWTGDGDKADGDSCDPWPFNKKCDPYFSICIDKKQSGSVPQWKNVCSYQSEVRTSVYDNDDDVDFPTNSQLNQFYNPSSFRQEEKWIGANVYVKVTENDANSNDPIDNHVFDLPGRPLGQQNLWAYPNSQDQFVHHWIDVPNNHGVNYARTRSIMSLKYKPVCCKDYYNYDCSVYCVPQAGLYTCDPLTGDKILEPTETTIKDTITTL